jgi:hypothetical protein
MKALRRVNAEEMAAYHAVTLARGLRQTKRDDCTCRPAQLNVNAAGIAFKNRRTPIAAFSEPRKPNDTGRMEVQGAYFPLLFALHSTCFS